LNICRSSATVNAILYVPNMLVSLGVRVIAANVTVHRYIWEKARTMQKLVNGDKAETVATAKLKRLQASIKLECVSFIFLIGALVHPVYSRVALIFGAVGAICVVITDTYLLVATTQLFLKLLTSILEEGSGVARASEGYKSMQKTKWMTVIGSTIAFASSSALYVMGILYFTMGDYGNPFYASPWLNVFVFWMNAGPVFNDVGVLFVCGVLKRFGEPEPQPTEQLKEEESFQFDSRAYQEGLPSAGLSLATNREGTTQCASSVLEQGALALSAASSEYGM